MGLNRSLGRGREQFFALPELSTFLPVRFDNGAELREVTIKCSRCGDELMGVNVRGKITRSFRRAVIVSATGLCTRCPLISTFRYRVYNDLSMTGRSPLTDAPSRWRRARGVWKH